MCAGKSLYDLLAQGHLLLERDFDRLTDQLQYLEWAGSLPQSSDHAYEPETSAKSTLIACSCVPLVAGAVAKLLKYSSGVVVASAVCSGVGAMGLLMAHRYYTTKSGKWYKVKQMLDRMQENDTHFLKFMRRMREIECAAFRHDPIVLCHFDDIRHKCLDFLRTSTDVYNSISQTLVKDMQIDFSLVKDEINAELWEMAKPATPVDPSYLTVANLQEFYNLAFAQRSQALMLIVSDLFHRQSGADFDYNFTLLQEADNFLGSAAYFFELVLPPTKRKKQAPKPLTEWKVDATRGLMILHLERVFSEIQSPVIDYNVVEKNLEIIQAYLKRHARETDSLPSVPAITPFKVKRDNDPKPDAVPAGEMEPASYRVFTDKEDATVDLPKLNSKHADDPLMNELLNVLEPVRKHTLAKEARAIAQLRDVDFSFLEDGDFEKEEPSDVTSALSDGSLLPEAQNYTAQHSETQSECPVVPKPKSIATKADMDAFLDRMQQFRQDVAEVFGSDTEEEEENIG